MRGFTNLKNGQMEGSIAGYVKTMITFKKIQNELLYYSLNIAGVEVYLSAPPYQKPSEEYVEACYEDGNSEGIAVQTTYKLLCIDKPIQLSKIYHLAEEKGMNFSRYGFCSCGNYRRPVWDEVPSIAQFCPCEKYVD